MFTGDRISAERCEKIGIFNRVVPDASLQEHAFEMALTLASGPREALSFMKENLEEALMNNFDQSLDGEVCTANPEYIESGPQGSSCGLYREAPSKFFKELLKVFME